MLRIGLKISPTPTATNDITELITLADDARRARLPAVWLPQLDSYDPLTAYAAIARDVPDVELGVSVLPVQPHHPRILAAQALTAQAASGGRLTLGLGVSHPGRLEDYGIPFERPVQRLTEHLDALLPILAGETGGDSVVRGANPTVPVILGALGPTMLRLAGERTTGTVTFLTGPKTISEYVVPAITSAAESAGRARPRVIVGLPVAVTDEPDQVRATFASEVAYLAKLPSYRRALETEGVAGAGDLAITGDESVVAAGIRRLFEAGATDLNATVIGSPEVRRRTLAVLGDLTAHRAQTKDRG